MKTTPFRSVAALSCALLSPSALAGVHYMLAGSFTLAPDLAAVDTLADGRLLGLRADGALLAQTSMHSSSWTQVGAVDASLFNAFGPSFLSVSPDGSRIAIGDGNLGAGASVLLLDAAALDPSSVADATAVALANYAAHWADNDTLYVTGAQGFAGVVSELRASTLATRVVVDSLDGASGGVVTDGAWLYTGNGFAYESAPGASQTGEVRAFRLSDLGGVPLSFEAHGLTVADALSAGSLAIDALGNLVVGGSEFGGETGFFSVIDSALLADALNGAGVVPDDLEAMFDPASGGAPFGYTVLFNRATGETIALAEGVAYRFTIPAPGGAGVLALAGALCARRRRIGTVEAHGPLPSGERSRSVDDATRVRGSYCAVPGAAALLALAGSIALAGNDPSSWFASEVVDYSPAPGQFVNDPLFNNPADALGPPAGGEPGEPATSNVVTLGGFGGSITLRFTGTVWDEPCNPFGVDAIVFGNSLYVAGNPRRRFAEAAHIEICYDANGNGLPDDGWFLIRGSSLPFVPADALRTQAWDNSGATPTPPANPLWYPNTQPAGAFSTSAYELPAMFAANIVALPPDATEEAVWGYADFTPTLTPPVGVDPVLFYTTPDDPFAIGVTPGSAGGDAFDIAWAVDPQTGAPADLPGFDFIRITTAVDAVLGPVGEISAEIGGVARVRPRVLLAGDATGDGVVNFLDLNAVLSDFGATGDALDGDVNCDGVVNFLDLNAVLSNFGTSGERGSPLRAEGSP